MPRLWELFTANRTEKQTRNMPPLWTLCMDGKLAEVRSALARGEDVNSKDSSGTTALMLAVWYKHNSIVKLLLDQPAVDVNVKSNNVGWTALHIAVLHNNAEGARMLLLHKGFNSANVTGNGGHTALMWAVYKNHNSIVKLLLDQPAVDVNLKNDHGETALICAAKDMCNNAEGAKMLLLHKNISVSANTTDRDGYTALMRAVRDVNPEVLRELVKHQCVSLDLGWLEGNQR